MQRRDLLRVLGQQASDRGRFLYARAQATKPATTTPKAVGAARNLQPIWSQLSEKVVRFEDSFDRSRGRFEELTGAPSDVAIFVNRSNRQAAISSLQKAGQKVRSGTNIFLYPEGTRSPDGRILPFKKGPFVLAIEAQVPIVPVAIDGSFQSMPQGWIWLRRQIRRARRRQQASTPLPAS